MKLARDFRSALVLVEPQFISGDVARGDRTAVLEDCIDALQAALGNPR